MKGVILAGGEGTRLRPISYYVQKCMMPVGEEQRPILEYIVRLFKHNGISDITLLVGYKHQQIVNYFDHGERFGVKLQYVIDNEKLKGSANAIVHAYRERALSEADDLIVYYGDILSSLSLKDLAEAHTSSKATATIAMAKGFKIRVGTAEVTEKGRIRKFIEKPELETPACIGILSLSGKALRQMDLISKTMGKENLDLMADVIPHLIEDGEPVRAFITEDFWYDVGSIESYEKLSNTDVEEKLGFLTKVKQPRGARTKQATKTHKKPRRK